MIISCGEALIDMLPRSSESGAQMFEPVVGGAVFNTAKALGRLGVSSGYFGALSEDAFGALLCDALDDAGVSHALCPRSKLPTALAIVSLLKGTASYSFHFSDTAGLSLRAEDLPDIPDAVTGMHFGGISLVAEPCGSAYEALLMREKDRRLISIDPNIRPSFVTDETAYRGRLQRLLANSHVIKISDEDLHWMYPQQAPETVAKTWLDSSAKLVVLTRGEAGAQLYSHQGEAVVEAVPAEVVDTVGAGDTFVAGLWAGLAAAGVDNQSVLQSVELGVLERAVSYAQRAASISVSRAGADSPWLEEMGA